MYNPDDDVLQEIQSSDSDEDISTRSKSHGQEIRELLSEIPLLLERQGEEDEQANVHVKLSQLHEIISDDEGDDVTSPIGSPPADISALGGRDKFLQLKRKLEEDQAKTFESIQPIQVTDVETLLESFRSERDQSRSSTTRIEANPKFLELYQQVKDRDHRILDLETKLMEQNRKVVDLEDNLNEKEKLLSSKNEAVSVVQQKFEAELRLKKDELEKSQRLLFELEKNLGKVQDQWKEDKDRFNTELKKQEEKYQKLLDSNKSLESTRFQLTTQMAELQEQLVHFQTTNETLLKEKSALESLNTEHSEKFIFDQQEFEKAKEQLEFDQELLEREKEILEKDLQSLHESKNSFSTEYEEFQLQKSILQEESQALAEEKFAVSREREIIDTEKETFYAEKEAFETEKKTFDNEKDAILAASKQEIEEKERKIQELTETGEKLQANLKRLKVQFQTKLKALKEEKAKEKESQLESETTDQGVSVVPELEAKLAEQLTRITELLNKVTELEEEKDLNQLKESLSTTEASLLEKSQSLTTLQSNLDQERENLQAQKQVLDSALAQLSLDQSSLETLKEQLSHQKESLEKEQENLRSQEEYIMQEKASLTEREVLLESSLQKLSFDQNALQEEKSSFNKEKENENLSLNFEREALCSQREGLQQEQELLNREREELKKAQEDLVAEKETLRTDKQGLAMERETWQWQSQEADDLRANLQSQPESSQQSYEQQKMILELQQTVQQQMVIIEEQTNKIQQLTSETLQLTSEVQELKQQLETARNNVKKLKLQFQAKLKQIKEKAAETAGGASSADTEKLTELQNKLAELEEEKGQLLLRLVDFEELQATHEALVSKLASMDSQLQANEQKIQKLEQGREQFQEIPLTFEPVVEPTVHATQQKQLSSSGFSGAFSDPFFDTFSPPAPLDDDQVRNLTKQVEILEQSLQAKAKKIQTLEESVKSLEEQIEFNREDFTSAVTEFDQAINKKNENHQKELALLEEQLLDKKQEVDNLKQMLEELEQSSVDQGVRETNTKREATENRKLQEEEHLENQQLLEYQEEKQIEILRLTGENADLYRQLEDTTQSLAESERELSAVQAKLSELTAEFSSKKASEGENHHELMELQEVKENLEKSLEESQEEVRRLSNLNVKLAQSSVTQDLREETFKREAKEKRKIQTEDRQQEVDGLKQMLVKLRHDSAEQGFRETITTLQEEEHIETQHLLECQEEKQIEILRLTGENADLYRQLERTTQNLAKTERQLGKVQAKLSDLTSELHSSDEENLHELLELQEVKEALEKSLQAAQEEVRRLSQLNAKLAQSSVVQVLDEEITKMEANENPKIKAEDRQQEIDTLKQRLVEFEKSSADQGLREENTKREATESRKLQEEEHLENQQLLEYEEEKKIDILRLTGENADLYCQLDRTTLNLAKTEQQLGSVQAKLSELTPDLHSKKSSEEENLHKLLELQEVKETLEKSLQATQEEVRRLSNLNVRLAQSSVVQGLREETSKMEAYENRKIQAADRQQEVDALMQRLVELEKSSADRRVREENTKREATESRKLQEKEHLENQQLLEYEEEKQIEILRLTGENADLYRQLEETIKKLTDRERELALIHTKLSDLTAEYNSKKSSEEENLHELLELQEVKENLEKSLEASTQEVQRLSGINVRLEQQISQVSESLQSASSDYKKIHSSAAEVPALQSEIERLSHEVALLSTSEAHLKSEITLLKEQLLDKDEEFDLTGKELSDLRNKVEELNAEIQTQRADLEPLQAEIASLKTQLVEKDEELEFTNDQIMTLSVKSGQAEKFEKAMLEAQTALSNKQFEVDRLLSELSLLNEANLEKEASSREEYIGKVEDLERNLNDAQTRILNAQEQIKHLTEQNASLIEEIQIKNAAIVQEQNELTNLRAEVEGLREELKKSAERENYVQLMETKVQSLGVVAEESEALSQALKSAEGSLKEKENILKEQENILRDMDKALKEALLAKETAILELVQTQASFDEVLRKQLESAVAHALMENQQATAHSSAEKEVTISRLQNQLSDLETLLESANSELKTKEVELVFTREEMGKLTEALNHVEKVVLKEVQEKEDQMKVQVVELTSLVNDKDQEIKKIMADYDEYYDQARVEIESKSKQVEALEQSLFEKNEAVTKLEETIRELKERHQTEIFDTIEKNNEVEESLLERIGALTEENTKLKTQVTQIEAQLKELKELQQVNPAVETMFQSNVVPVQGSLPYQQVSPITNPFQQFGNQSTVDFFDSLPVASGAQEIPSSTLPEPSPAQAQTSEQQLKQEELLAEKEKQIYDQSVQITELEITVDELRAQLSEITELKMEVEALQHQNFGLSTEVQSLQKQIATLQSERTRKLEQLLDMEAISGPKSSKSPSPAPSSQPVDELVVRSTAYITTDTEAPSAALEEKQAQITALSTELRELKVKSGRVLQKLRQTTNKYEELQKAHEALKTKSEFSLEAALEGEISDQLKKKDAVIAEKTKLIQEIQAERVKLQNQVDVLERASDRFTDGKENQDRTIETLLQQKKSLEQEIQGLKWKLEEVEEGANFNAAPESTQGDLSLENNSLRVQNAALAQEIDGLQQEVNYQRQVVANLHYQLEQVVYNQGQAQLQTPSQVATPQDSMYQQTAQPELSQSIPQPQGVEVAQPQGVGMEQSGPFHSIPAATQEQFQQLTQEEVVERAILEQKIELLQNKISELEANETRYYDELQKTKAHAQSLDMENLFNQEIILDLNRRLNSTERDNLKSKILQEEVNRLILILDDKDNVKCDQFTSEILRLQEEKAVLEYQLATIQMPHPQQLQIPSTESGQRDLFLELRESMAELERKNIVLEIDLRREINARRIVQEQLFFKQAAKSQNHRLGVLVGNPMSSPISLSPSRGSPMPSPGFGIFSTPTTSSNSPRVATPDSSPKLPL